MDDLWSEFSGLNVAYVQELYARYVADPRQVDAATRALFERHAPPIVSTDGRTAAAETVPGKDPRLVVGAVGLANAIRAYGHRAARLDPLGSPPPGDASLNPARHGIREEELASLPASVVGGRAAEDAGNALVAIRRLRDLYQGTGGYEFAHIDNADERAWLHDAVESARFRPPRDPIDELQVLRKLTEVGSFERFLHRAFPGQTRFSLEGLGMMVPVLDEIIGAAAESGTRAVVLGMAHRGRLNVLAHVLGKSYEQIIAEFMGRYRRPNVSPSGSSDPGWTGDVKYHLGARRAYRGGQQVDMVVTLAPNPSHLEFVDPVIEGMCRALDEERGRPGPARVDVTRALPILIHGDASFPAQGVVAETLNLSGLEGYQTGGTIHLIANNQLGFTTPPEMGRSTTYSSDLALGFEVPVIHVNADDVEACIGAARLAHAYREAFHKDILLDLVGYRRWGHNEGDEPSFTQPRMYAAIAEHPTVRELWAGELVRRGLLSQAEAERMLQEAIERLHAIRRALSERFASEADPLPASAGREAGGPGGGLGTAADERALETAVPQDTLRALNTALWSVPDDFHLHPKLRRPFERRLQALDPNRDGADAEDARIEWAHAEALAVASLVREGTPVRLTGQDTERGTFSQRHLVLHDAADGRRYIPLQQLGPGAACFDIWNSPLSEMAPLGFEYGYSVQAPEALVLWEAQYGDFINSAQVIVDQFVVSGASKWGQRSGLVLLLPHAYEGQGPEHSSARLERFLQLAAEDNLRIANCTTAAQYFHLLRRQARLLAVDPRPLVLLTPKSLLRHPMAASSLQDLAHGSFQPVLADDEALRHPQSARRLVLCSGKVYVDLQTARQQPGSADSAEGGLAVARVEELYPFPAERIASLIGALPRLEEVVWLQEEPRNLGAWTYVAPRLRDLLPEGLPLTYIGRTRRASPAEGAYEWHAQEQDRIVAAVLESRAGVRPADEV